LRLLPSIDESSMFVQACATDFRLLSRLITNRGLARRIFRRTCTVIRYLLQILPVKRQ